MFDAYTVKKIAPRLLVAVIGINLSIYLCVAAVDITNIIGGGIGDLLREPFKRSDAFKNPEIPGSGINVAIGSAGAVGFVGTALTGVGLATGAGAAGATGFLAVITKSAFGVLAGQALVALAMFLIVAMISVALIALAIAATIIIRFGAIILLTVISPIAIVLLVLPGTEKYFKQWWDVFLKVLVMYPIIAVLFALSDILAAVLMVTVVQQGNVAGLVAIMVVILALYAPLFMIPFAFKMAGGILGGIYDFANKNGIARVNERVGKWKQDPNSWYGSRAFARKATRHGRGLTMDQQLAGVNAGGRSLLRREGFSAARLARRGALGTNRKILTDVEQAEKENEAVKAVGPDDDSWHGAKELAAGRTREQAKAKMRRLAAERWASLDPENRNADNYATQADQATLAHDEASLEQHLAQAETVVAQVGDNQVTGAIAIKKIGQTKTGWTESIDMMNDINEVAGDNRALAAHLLGEALQGQDQAGRVDNSGFGYSAGVVQLEEMHRNTAKADSADRKTFETTTKRQLNRTVLSKNSGGKLIGAHEKALQNLLLDDTNDITFDVNKAQEDFDTARRNRDEPAMRTARVRVERETAKLANIYDVAQHAAPEIAEHLANHVFSQNVQGTNTTIRTQIDEMRGKPKEYAEFANMRRDFEQREIEGMRAQGEARPGLGPTG